ncbi:Nucleoporin GLE1 [Schistosoma japonicum]|nr:Nucleoporin GLE1 [Schistosoma japonicum]
MSGEFELGYLLGIEDAWISAVAKYNNAVKAYEKNFKRSQLSIARVTDHLEKSFASLALNVNAPKSNDIVENKYSDKTNPGLGEIFPSIECMTHYGFTRRIPNHDLLKEIINRIISIRVDATELRYRNSGSALDSLDSLLNEIEEIEARALTLMTSPSPIFDDCDGMMDYQMELIMRRLELQAKECLEMCKTLVSTNFSATKQLQSTISAALDVPVSENDSVFPTFDKARALLENYTNILYPSLWDSRFKKDALKIKQDITCACSQALFKLKPINKLLHKTSDH